MEVLELARWQFGITTVYHFLMVPLTIGLSILVAGMQTAWVRTGNERYLKMTKFWGKLLLVNFAMGVVTGIVQEFQFGMNWSAYSRFVGDVFGAPLAMEGLVAFFVESTFLGLWIFGWDRLPKRVHLACVWAFSLATVASAYFILAANSWMQHPVGVEFVDGTPTMNSIWAVLTNNTALAAIPHTVAGTFSVAAAFVVGVSAWQLWRKRQRNVAGKRMVDQDVNDEHQRVWRSSLKLGTWTGVVAFGVLAITGDLQGKLMFEQQPMKMAAAEALCHTEQPASFSILAIGDVADANCENVKTFTVPALLSFLAHNDFTTEVKGIEDLVGQYQERYGSHYPDDPALGELAGQPIDYVPNLPVTYWGFRIMIGFGAISAATGVLALWLTRRDRVPDSKWFPRLALLSIATPFIANSAGWIFTEMGRQPFVVVPNPTGVDGVWMFTAQAVSNVSAGEVWVSLISLTALYAVLGVVEVFLMTKYIRGGVDAVYPPKHPQGDSDSNDHDDTGDSKGDALAFAY
ncbi:cytochrome BD ubiquinol oxidase subunit I [Prauserella marina]|uniref:Cytochrome d ubiquinol oxidase subunit I n=1 Tax=Prauserella marina TaxID=530584 RepID=A0A222VIJ0_9PSEU|nr:cytochrome ubiquinol oxidase subunit I [Prauserella marina]ASR33738.1 cytochrome BD ubiquinol oxidase subunit I [Prauserella marina]PWV82304.1 cytochrome bd-I ubiquinol oxidase subunit 1 apoprotein [Prauserella marina]SDC65796.1 cytochrome d ubiquinol oxidase subunit I [Prauserella marina]